MVWEACCQEEKYFINACIFRLIFFHFLSCVFNIKPVVWPIYTACVAGGFPARASPLYFCCPRLNPNPLEQPATQHTCRLYFCGGSQSLNGARLCHILVPRARLTHGQQSNARVAGYENGLRRICRNCRSKLSL